jgi:hypothetical protein
MRTGYRLAIGIASITIVMALVLLVVELLGSKRDPTAYGQVPVPGRASVSLPAGEVIIYNGERAGIDFPFPLRVPPRLRLTVRTTNGQLLLGSTPYVSDQFPERDTDTERRAIAKLRVPEAGNYEAVSPTQVPLGVVKPVISFGHDGSRNFGYVGFALAGGLLLASILGAGTALVARAGRS